MLSNHYQQDNHRREELIQQIGLGTIVHTTLRWDVKRNRYFKYEITDNAIIIVKATDNPNLIITKLVARPSRLLQYWKDAPHEIVMKAVLHAQAGYIY